MGRSYSSYVPNVLTPYKQECWVYPDSSPLCPVATSPITNRRVIVSSSFWPAGGSRPRERVNGCSKLIVTQEISYPDRLRSGWPALPYETQWVEPQLTPSSEPQ